MSMNWLYSVQMHFTLIYEMIIFYKNMIEQREVQKMLLTKFNMIVFSNSKTDPKFFMYCWDDSKQRHDEKIIESPSALFPNWKCLHLCTQYYRNIFLHFVQIKNGIGVFSCTLQSAFEKSMEVFGLGIWRIITKPFGWEFRIIIFVMPI